MAIVDNKIARQSGESAAELLHDEAAKHTASMEHFWRAVVDAIPSEYIPIVVQPKSKPMTTVEAATFAEEILRFGKYTGCRVRDVPLDYLVWLEEQPDDFRKSLNRYLRHPSVMAEQAAAEAAEEEK